MQGSGRGPALTRGFADGARLYVRPLPRANAAPDGEDALPLAGGPLAFDRVQAIAWDGGPAPRRADATVAAFRAWAQGETAGVRNDAETWLDRLTAPRPVLAGLGLDTPRIMGVVNVTPDSFYDGGRHATTRRATDHGLRLLADGADLVDVGGESTRPGATPVPEAEERERAIPVVESLATHGAVVSIDTRHARTMRAAARAGARIVNDVAALSRRGSLQAAADLGVPVVLMHADADPQTMQDDPRYACAPLAVYDYLVARVAAATAAGIPPEKLIVDPGIGFAKTAEHNAEVLDHLTLFHGLGCPVLLGASRKSFIARFHRGESPDERLGGSLAAALWGAAQGVHILRVHDVAQTAQALAVWGIARDARRLGSAPARPG